MNLSSVQGRTDQHGRGHITGFNFVNVEPHPKEACVPHRPIRLYELVPGPDRLLDRRRTDRFGRFHFVFRGGHSGRPLSLRIYRKVIRKEGRHLHYCNAQKASIFFPTSG